MVIYELNILRTLIGPSEADAELVVHTDRPLPRPILLEAVQAVSRRMFEVIEPRRRIQLEKAAPHPLEEVRRETLGAFALKDLPSLLALPTKDHGESLPRAACSEVCYISQVFVARFATLIIRCGEAACRYSTAVALGF